MRKVLPLFLLVIWSFTGTGQELPAAYRDYISKYPEGPALNHRDSVFMMNLPEKEVPETALRDQLPPVVDNSELPFLRPVFMQEGPSCGQAAMVGYNFTYEMACKRDQPAQYPQTQYPTHFTWNFQNGGNGYWGVSYFHSIEILRLCGCMNSYDYGDFYDDGMRWINGYDLYYNGMYNRVRGVNSIHTGTVEGILALKHWLFNHMGESDFGGVASYYANVPWNAEFLNDTTPEGGKYVMTGWFPYASHAMTIVGYNDSIRFDYNNDGMYTNDIDLNYDQVIDPRDWEIGGVKFVNSHGIGAQDSGFCYMMYKCLAEDFENGGVWNKEVHILDVDEDYQPLVTLKVKLKHTCREKVKVLAGVSQDTTDAAPAWTMEFPIIDNQGSNHFMQGSDTAESLKTLEFGLDVTPLLSHLAPGEPAKFFFIVDETDPDFQGNGEITAFSVMDYTDGEQEFIAVETPVLLENNSRSMASVIYTPIFEIVQILTDTLPPYSVDVPYSFQLTAGGGRPPYSWEAISGYSIMQSIDSFPMAGEIQVLETDAADTIMAVPLGFSFPFYGKDYDTVYMHINGHLQFDNDQLPWPYMSEPDLMFRSYPMIAPMAKMEFTIMASEGDGGWVDIDDTSALFRWKLSMIGNLGTTDLNFAARIIQNGNIEFFYGPSTLQGIDWLGGISAGNKTDFVMSPFSGQQQIPQGSKIVFGYRPLPGQFSLSESGLLTGTINSDEKIFDRSFRVTDRSGMQAVKTFQLTSAPYLYLSVHPGNTNMVEYGDTVALDLVIRNGGQDTLRNATLELQTEDDFIEMTDSWNILGNLAPGQVVTIPQVFTFIVATGIPDQHDFFFNVVLETTGKTWQKDLLLKGNAPNLIIERTKIDDEDERLNPGETAPLMVTFRNIGHASVEGVVSELVSTVPEVQVTGDPVQDFGALSKGASVTRPFTLYAEDFTPEGFNATLILATTTQPGLTRLDTIILKVGKTPVLVIDMAMDKNSGPVIFSKLNELNVLSEYDYSITPKIFDYQSLFICLGYYYQNHLLTMGEGQLLADYLDAGGKVYLESRTTWKDDPGTPAQPKFNIQYGGNITIYDTITGINGTFTQGINVLNEAIHYFSFYNLIPVPPAYSILQDNDNLLSCAVAYDAGVYKTIGALFEFGTQADISSNAAEELLTGYLEFFGMDVNPIGLEEKPGKAEIFLYPNPAGEFLTVNLKESLVVGRQLSVRLSVVNLFGQTLLQLDNIRSFPYQIDISALSPGLYFIRIEDDNGNRFSAKFIKSRN
jgi:hypothetical protein